MGSQVLLLKKTDFIKVTQLLVNQYIKVKNPNWPKANYLVIYKHDGGAEYLELLRTNLASGQGND